MQVDEPVQGVMGRTTASTKLSWICLSRAAKRCIAQSAGCPPPQWPSPAVVTLRAGWCPGSGSCPCSHPRVTWFKKFLGLGPARAGGSRSAGEVLIATLLPFLLAVQEPRGALESPPHPRDSSSTSMMLETKVGNVLFCLIFFSFSLVGSCCACSFVLDPALLGPHDPHLRYPLDEPRPGLWSTGAQN